MRLYNVPVNKQKLLVVPIGDIQFTGTDPNTAGGCSVNHLKVFLGQIRDLATTFDAQVAWIGTGDYVDLISPSNRKGYRASGLYSTATRFISHSVYGIVDELYRVLSPYVYSEEVVALCRGHHYFEYDPELELPWVDTEFHLASLFGLEYLPGRGVCAGAGHVTFSWPDGNNYRVLFQHGQGNGQSLAFGLNKLDRMAGGWEDVDALVMGHTHKVGEVKKAKLSVQNGEIVHRDIRLITSGAFLKGWKIGEVLYPEEKQLAPIPLGGSAVLVWPDASQPSGVSSIGMTL